MPTGKGKRKGIGNREEEGEEAHGVAQGDTKGAEVGGVKKSWAARYNTWLLMKLTPKGVVFSFWSQRAERAYLAIWQEVNAVLGPVAGLATLKADMVGVLVPLQVLPTIPSLRQEAVSNNSLLMQQLTQQLLCSM